MFQNRCYFLFWNVSIQNIVVFIGICHFCAVYSNNHLCWHLCWHLYNVPCEIPPCPPDDWIAYKQSDLFSVNDVKMHKITQPYTADFQWRHTEKISCLWLQWGGKWWLSTTHAVNPVMSQISSVQDMCGEGERNPRSPSDHKDYSPCKSTSHWSD